MKKFKQFILPAVIVLMGAGAAFATNAAKVSDSDLVRGYYFDSSSSQCIESNKDCNPVGIEACTWTDSQGSSHTLSRLNGTICVQMLFEPQ
ncbi:MAG: DUF6520 family protein [Petrimonas sp.]|uniref:DUF6520 family protein n=1 Tax=Petrimonas sp. TaxID=2023866 RepID=UPI002B3E5F9E|nr:DUF6520 family protein [Petrimonas sp.]